MATGVTVPPKVGVLETWPSSLAGHSEAKASISQRQSGVSLGANISPGSLRHMPCWLEVSLLFQSHSHRSSAGKDSLQYYGAHLYFFLDEPEATSWVLLT